MAGIRATGRTQPACPARCSERILQGRAPEVEDAAAAPATSSGRDRTRILTPDSSSQLKSTPYDWKHSRLGRCCSGSLDRLVLGHLCTDRPENTCKRTARTRERTIGQGDWAAGHEVHTWGTADTPWQVSHSRAARAPAPRKVQHRSGTQARWRPRVATTVGGAVLLGVHLAVHSGVRSSARIWQTV